MSGQSDMRQPFTVWRFLSPSSGEVAIVARRSEPGDATSQHEYQRVLWQGMAMTKAEAHGKAMAEVGPKVCVNGVPVVLSGRRIDRPWYTD